MTDENRELRIDELFDNPSPRVPVALALDTSGSMDGEPIRELNDGVGVFFDALLADPTARFAAEVAIVSFGGTVDTIRDFAGVEQAPPAALAARGGTPMGEAVSRAIDLLERRKAEYKAAGVEYHQPWLVLMTDGQPTDDVAPAAARTSKLAAARKLSVFPVGVGDAADMAALAAFSPRRAPLRLKGLRFEKFFEWLSRSVSAVSRSIPGQSVPLDPDLDGWRQA